MEMSSPENTGEKERCPGFLRQREMEELIDSEKDPITRDLMALANIVVFGRVARHDSGPISDFDLLYFMELMQDFASRHDTIRLMLDGRGSELSWWPDN